MKAGDIILTPIPQSDGRTKNRPALVLCELPGYRDFLVCGISTQLHQCIQDFDEIVFDSNTDFQTSGLTQSSLIRLGFLTTIPGNMY